LLFTALTARFNSMLRIREVKTKSGSTAVQVVQYIGHRAKISKHIGSAKNDQETQALKTLAVDWIEKHTAQTSLFPNERQKILFVDKSECIAITHNFAYEFFARCIDQCNLSHFPQLLIDLVIMRLIEPSSKLQAINLLARYFGIKYSQRIYQAIPKFIDYKTDIEKQAFKVAEQAFNEQFYYVLYDVTTLYFESFKADDLKIQGFSKDNKSQQPQIVIGLLVTQSGFPLSYNVFSGNTFEGKTMLPIIEDFICSHPDTKPIVVADAAMLDEERLAELRGKNISYIVGARLANANIGLVKQVNTSLNAANGSTVRLQTKHGDLVCDFSLRRYKKELTELNKLIQRAEELVAKQSLSNKTKFVKRVTKEKIELNTALIEKRKLLLGIMGYCTDLSEDQLPSNEVIDRYHQLWHVEQSFRMSKFDLQARPIYHQKEDAIRSHVMICFIALIIEKYLELKTSLSLRKIRMLVWSITESHIQDTVTKEVYKFSSPSQEIMNSPLASLIKKWRLIPH
jgi:transposase